MTELKTKLQKIRRTIVVGKYTMQRGYSILNVPMIALMGAGILYPYAISYVPSIKMWHLAIVAFVGIMIAGWIDRALRILHEEQNYITETNPMLMAGLRGELGKSTGSKTESYLKETDIINIEEKEKEDKQKI